MRNFGTPIVGMSCRFPSASNINAFWNLLSKGEEGAIELSVEALQKAGVPSTTIDSPSYIRRAGVLAGVDNFDHKLFGISVGEAKLMDPQQKLLLEVCYGALEDASLLEISKSLPTAVFASAGGITSSSFAANITALKNDYSFATGSTVHIAHDKDFLATRIAHRLNLKGPAVSVQTACSSSLVALHLARQALYCGDCDIAIVAASCVRLPHISGYLSDDPILSKDGHCRTFSQDATGTFFSSGVAAVVLRREQDINSDHAYATVRGSAINNDGGQKVSYTASSVPGQVAAMTKAIKNAEIEAQQLSYVECHGTATKIGDPLEIKSLKETFSTFNDKQDDTEKHCGLGSVKSNIGHTEQAAGLAGLIKVALMLHHKKRVPTLHSDPLNTKLNIEDSPFFVEQTASAWQNLPEQHGKTNKQKRYAGVNSLGMGGTNAFAIIEEYQPTSFDTETLKKEASANGVSLYPFCLSAKSEKALIRCLENWQKKQLHWKHYALSDTAYSATISRSHYKYRTAILLSDMSELADILSIFTQGETEQTNLTPMSTRACEVGIQLPSLMESSSIDSIIRCSRGVGLAERYTATLNDLVKKGVTTKDDRECLNIIQNIALTISLINSVESVGIKVSEILTPSCFPGFYCIDLNSKNSWQIDYMSIQNTLSKLSRAEKMESQDTNVIQSFRSESSSSKSVKWLSITESPKVDNNIIKTNKACANIDELVANYSENWIAHTALGLYKEGAQIDWSLYYAQLHPETRKVPLPTYAFENITFPLFLTPEEK